MSNILFVPIRGFEVFKRALEDGWTLRETAGQELGENADCSDFIADGLHDEEYPREIIDRVVETIKKSEGWV